MRRFVEKHADKIAGTLSCFDRVLFRGYLPLFTGYEMAELLRARGVRAGELKRFFVEQAERLKERAEGVPAGRPPVPLSPGP